MGAVLTKQPPGMDQRQSATYWDDMYNVSTVFTTLASDTAAAVAAQDADNGRVNVLSGTSDNGEAEMYTKKVFKFADSRSIIGEALVQYTEANTDDANIWIGFTSATGADVLADDGAGPSSNFSGIGFYKVDGGTVWKCIVSKGTSQQTATVLTTGQPASAVPGSSSFVRFRVEFAAVGDMSKDQGEATFWIDGKQAYDAADISRNKPIKFTFTYTSAAAMGFSLYVKSGGANAETLVVDDVGWSQTRTYGA